MSILPASSALSAAAARSWSPPRIPAGGCGTPTSCGRGDRYQPSAPAQGPDPGDLFQRLAQAAKSTARANSPHDLQGVDGQIGAILSRTFGLAVVQVDLAQLTGEESHVAAGMVSHRQDAQGTITSAAAMAVDDLRLAAEGTITTADGQQFHFQLDYQRHQEAAMAAQQTTVAGPGAADRPDPLSEALANANPAHRLRRLLAMLPKAQADGVVDTTA